MGCHVHLLCAKYCMLIVAYWGPYILNLIDTVIDMLRLKVLLRDGVLLSKIGEARDEVSSMLQVGRDDVHQNALVGLLVQCLKRDAFYQLRTVEQVSS